MKTNAKPIEGLPGMENLLTAADVARIRGVKTSAVYRAIHRGKLVSAGALHGRMYIDREKALEWQPLTDNAARAQKAGVTRWEKAKAAKANSPTATEPPAPAQTPQDGHE